MSSEAQNVIADVMLGHGFSPTRNPFGADYCKCGKAVSVGNHTRHVAEEIDKALGGLTRETLPAREGWILPPGWIGDRTAARWVSGWSEA
ncbi:hypothetical protein SEA_RENAUD18_93 [Mycobacterium phage Renaud18]|uniref:Uncharacterized protein n=1 Tax=Mycobacterium phage Renaud18 TaxID=2301701 RepID=A0A385E2P1_9CAUD|nr:hypothetical protein HWB85_gp093 [Mycobacterium phage Renaud18]AXQ64999.1 hypothetical protein SEA_RENAUD18_93 [Mycobacterium phage Renaud18]